MDLLAVAAGVPDGSSERARAEVAATKIAATISPTSSRANALLLRAFGILLSSRE